MSNFWPDDFEVKDTQSPREILKAAQEEWQTKSDGIMDLVLQDAESKSGNPMIIVHAKHLTSNRTVTLFSIIHRPNRPYPATIQPKEDDLPRFLKKSYYKPSANVTSALDTLTRMQGETVSNEWVSATPSEFRKKLAEVFNLELIKSEILNLLSISNDNENQRDGGLSEDSEEE